MTPQPLTTQPVAPTGAGALSFAEVMSLPVTVDLVTAGRAVGIGRTTAYLLARTGQFPCPVLRVGGTYRVPTAGLLRALGLDTAVTGFTSERSGVDTRSGLGLGRLASVARA